MAGSGSRPKRQNLLLLVRRKKGQQTVASSEKNIPSPLIYYVLLSITVDQCQLRN